jgi:carbon-monoxide dehydrogenase medium subunit
MTTNAQLLDSAAISRRAPLLRLVAAGITGGWAIRNQGTVGGSAIAARPPSDMPAALVACGARAVVAGPAGVRHAAAGELFAGAMRSTLAACEVLTGFDLPAGDAAAGYVKLKRGASSWPIATAAALVALGDDGCCTRATLVLGGVAATPLSVDLDDVLVGQEITPEALAAAAQHAGAALVKPWSDALAPAAYRAAVAAPVARRALTMAWDNARHGR